MMGATLPIVAIQSLLRSHKASIFALLATCPLLGCEELVLEQLSLAAALDYVQRHPEYVIANPEGEDVLVSELPSKKAGKLDRHLAGDWVARQLATRYGDVDPDDRIALALRSVEVTRDNIVPRRVPGIYFNVNDCVCDRKFSDAAFARLVRGVSNCDGVNHVLMMLLIRREQDARLNQLEVGNEDGKPDGGHTLAVIPSNGGAIFVDAWADFGVMVLSESVAAGVQTLAEIVQSSEPGRNDLYTHAQYADSHRVYKTDYDYGERYDGGPDLTIPSDLPPITDARSAYLRARVFHLYDLVDEAIPLYEQAVEMSCVNPMSVLCQISTIWLNRVTLSEGPFEYSR